MESIFISLYVILGLYYLFGLVAYLRIFLKNKHKNRIYLNAIKFNRETEIDSIIENSFKDSDSDNDSQDLSYAGY